MRVRVPAGVAAPAASDQHPDSEQPDSRTAGQPDIGQPDSRTADSRTADSRTAGQPDIGQPDSRTADSRTAGQRTADSRTGRSPPAPLRPAGSPHDWWLVEAAPPSERTSPLSLRATPRHAARRQGWEPLPAAQAGCCVLYGSTVSVRRIGDVWQRRKERDGCGPNGCSTARV